MTTHEYNMSLFESTIHKYNMSLFASTTKENVNGEKDARGNTALHFAAGLGLAEKCRELVETFGADVGIKNKAGLRPVDLALNLQEQYNHSYPMANYDEVVSYFDSIMAGEDWGRYFHRDNYKLFILETKSQL